jgi:hypothetical protein
MWSGCTSRLHGVGVEEVPEAVRDSLALLEQAWSSQYLILPYPLLNLIPAMDPAPTSVSNTI